MFFIYNENMAKNNVSLGSKLGISNEVLDVIKSELVDTIYPVGAIYISYDSTSPATLFGGTWEAIQGRFLLAENTDYPAGNTGGEATTKLKVANLPMHAHTYMDGRHAWGQSTSGTGVIAYDSGTTGAYGYRTGGAWGDRYDSKGDDVLGNMKAEEFSNLPPYLSVYMWRRTA